MEFKDVKPGMVFRQDIGGIYGTQFWFVYQKTSNKFITIMFHTRKSHYDRVAVVTVTRDLYNDTNYHWRERNPTSAREIMRYKKKLIPALFEEL